MEVSGDLRPGTCPREQSCTLHRRYETDFHHAAHFEQDLRFLRGDVHQRYIATARLGNPLPILTVNLHAKTCAGYFPRSRSHKLGSVLQPLKVARELSEYLEMPAGSNRSALERRAGDPCGP